ncbi:MAG TPA: AAA family ATPase, partial [Chitinophagales bacterium]|nr:AAA family ATPase [Chitinophagales bacterium]
WIQKGRGDCDITAVLSTAEGVERGLNLHLERGNNLRDIFQNNADTLSRIDRALAHADRNYFTIALGASRRVADGSRYRTPENFYETRRANNVATLFNTDANLTSLESWAVDLDYNDDQKARDVIQSVLKAFMPNVHYDGIDRRSRRLLFRTPDGIIPLDSLSEGYQNIATWVGDLLYRITNHFPDYKRPLVARGLLLVDEIDMHLDPNWQRMLFAFLENELPNFQVVATTHSPLTARLAGPGELFVLHRKNNAFTAEQFQRDPEHYPLDEDAVAVV